MNHLPRRTALATIVLLSTTSCGGGQPSNPGAITVAPPAPTPSPTPSPTPTATPTPTPTPTASAPACNRETAIPTSLSPYSQAAFTAVLDNALRLQFPTSGGNCITTSQLQAFSIDRDNFFLDSLNRMAFVFDAGIVDDDSSITNRMELRGASFDAVATGKSWDATFALPVVATRSTSFTIGQIFSDTLGTPILRIAVIASRSGVANHVWAVYRRDTGDGQTSFTDLGPAPTGDATARIRMDYNSNGGIAVFSSATGQTITLTDNFTRWAASGQQTYFKAGCYLQDPGSCDVRFTALRFDR